MNFPFETRQPGPQRWLVIALCTIYLLAGVFGHDPWKSEDAIGLAVAHGFYSGDTWLKPTLAGEAWLEAEPLYHWVAATTAAATQLFLPFHDGARLASAVFGALFLLLLANAARRLYGEDAGWGAPLLAIGTLGLLVPIHEAQPAVAVLAATTGVYWGAALQVQRPLLGGTVMGCALGACFLAGGLGAALPPLTLLLLPLIQRRWMTLVIACALGTLIAGAWILPLAQHEPVYLEAWWSADIAALAPLNGFSAGHAKFLGWVAWPVLFIAPWAIWRGRRQLTSSALLPPLLGLVVAFIWFLAHEPKTTAILPLLPPLILLAATGSASLRRGAANAWDWFGMMTLSIAIALIWLGASALLAGWPAKIASNAARLEPGFIGQFSLPALLVALAGTAAWVLVLLRLPRSPWRGVSRWAAGVTIAWVLLVALLMPWIDYGKTYRPVVASLRQALPEDSGCVGRMSLGAPQRAALDYFGGIRTRWGNKVCPWLIMQGGPQEETPEGWTKTWEGHRPGDRSEWLRLYRRTAP